MGKLREMIQWQTNSGERVTLGAVSVTPQSQALIIRWPFGGWVWNRPVAVLVENDGGTQRIPIVDITRRAQWSLVGLAFVLLIVTLLMQRRRNRNEQ